MAFLPELLLMIIASISATALFLLAPANSSLAIARLVQPHQTLSWPSRHDLTFVDLPEILAADRPHSFSVIDRKGNSIRRLTLDWRDMQGHIGQIVVEGGSDRISIELPPQKSDLEIVASADDSRTKTRRVQVVPAPRLVTSEWWIEPPSCMGIKAYPSPSVSSVPEGSQLQWTGMFDTAITKADLYSSSGEWIGASELQSDAMGTRFRFPLLPAIVFTQPLRMEWRNQQGLTSDIELKAIELVVDTAPTIKLSHDELLDGDVVMLAFDGVWKLDVDITDNSNWRELKAEVHDRLNALSPRIIQTWLPDRPVDKNIAPSSIVPHDRVQLQIELPKASSEPLNPWPQKGQLVALASDPCDHQGKSDSLSFELLSPDDYVERWSISWESWLEELESWRHELEALRRADSTKDGKTAKAFVLAIDQSLHQLDGPSDSLIVELERLEARAGRQRVASWPAPARARLGLQALRQEISPLLQTLKQLRRDVDLATDEATKVARIADLDSGWMQVFEILDRQFGPAARRTRQSWIERLERALESQKVLRTETLEWQVSGQLPTQQNSTRQSLLAAETEQMSADAADPRDNSARSVRELLGSSGVAMAQRRAAISMNEHRVGSALAAQDEAIAGLEQILLELRSGSPHASNSESLQMELSAIERMLIGEQNMLEAWFTVDPSLFDESLRKQSASSWRSLADRLDASANSSTDLDTQSTLKVAAQSLRDAAIAVEGGDAEKARQKLDDAVEGVRAAHADAQGEASGDSSTPPSSSQSVLPNDLARWIGTQRAVIARMTSGPPQAPSIPSESLAGRWWSGIAIDEEQLSQAIAASMTDERQRSQPLAIEELQQVSERLNTIAADCRVQADLGKAWEPADSLMESANEILQRLERLEESETRAILSETLVLPDASAGEPQDSTQPAAPAELRGELVRLRDRQVQLLESTLTQRRKIRPGEKLEASLAALLIQDQRRLLSVVEILDQGWRESQSRDSIEPQEPREPTLPGLGDLPGLPQTTPNRVTSEGEDLGATRSPLEPVTVAMEESLLRLTEGEVGPPTEVAQRRAISELDRLLGGTPPEPSPGSGSSAGSSAGAEARATDSTSAATDALLPDSVWNPSGIWGQLPERVQRSLRESGDVRWVEGFEELSIEYFRAIQEAWER